MKQKIFAGVCVAWLLISLAPAFVFADEAADRAAAGEIDEPVLRSHIRFLAHDLLEGRGPGSRGDLLAQAYIATQFEGLGLVPAGENGWLQPVPLVGVATRCPPVISFWKGRDSVELKYYDDYIATAGMPAEKTGFKDAEVVFVGYGMIAPEFGWNDYKGADLKGKVLLMMNNDPEGDPELFAGKRRLYYGRWDYKYAMAAQQGAAGAIIIHTTPSAGYPYQVVQTSWSGEEFELRTGDEPRLQMRGWVTEDAARRVVSLAGRDLDELRADAESRDFHPVPLGATLSMELTASVRESNTANVLGLLKGSDPEKAGEMVVYMAHHDHLGFATERDERGDNICNGAVDNASGVAALLSIAKAYASLPERPARSILFAAVGAEEQGLLGSKYLAANPPTAAGNLAAVLNIDGVNIFGRTRDVNVIGLGKSNLDEHVERVAKEQSRVVTPDHFPDRGYYYRSDQFSLAKIGVPGVYLHSGIDVIGKPEGWGRQQKEEWVEKVYHQPSDEYRDDWRLDGAVEDIQLLFHVGLAVARQDELPAWTPGDEFEAARKKALAER
jgi:Zn-dependent M28 family amino/carboxypeptidase